MEVAVTAVDKVDPHYFSGDVAARFGVLPFLLEGGPAIDHRALGHCRSFQLGDLGRSSMGMGPTEMVVQDSCQAIRYSRKYCLT